MPAKKKSKGKNADGEGAAREETKRADFLKVFKTLCVDYKVKEHLKRDVENQMAPKEEMKQPPITKMFLMAKHNPTSVKVLCDTIKGTRYDYLQELILCDTRLGDLSAMRIAETLRYTMLSRLELRDVDASVKFAKVMGEALALESHTKLQKLVLDYNPLGTEGARYIAEGLKNNIVLKELSLRYCQIEAKGGKYLGEMLHPMEDPLNPGVPHPNTEMKKALERLNLTGNPLHCAGIGMLSQGLARNRTLKSLVLENTSFGEDRRIQPQTKTETCYLAIQALSEACALCSTLTELNIYGNLMNQKGAEILLAHMEHTSHITDIKLTEFLNREMQMRIKMWLTVNKTKKAKTKKKPSKLKKKKKKK
mmetsp:Transcript_19762/g.35261  ORF Transcript_19762/g.35261 Transcript_19762/m.35261 type:complete len:365 (-) Transcript_19762:126-1220(-)|eukprot:CAMPEP_0197524328 /NCGR_PEP_ID=MMETSP1318-20131121/9031_1 /TAXON_ID=552666 /ORGANISM="Partenskyella glossopodia, Strain RCC365" /LENGTH=364 /DNA_ID=CAMNT_0043077259 /DNA_START=56 /DNA_END=1150 /DNA_ORIENTATION=-